MAEKIILKVVAETKEASKDIEKVGTGANTAAAETSLLGGAMNMVKGAMLKVKTTAKLMFGSIKAGIASTGIGVLVLAVISLVSYFTKTKRGAESLQVALAGFKAVMAFLTDVLSHFGEVIINAFSNPKKFIMELWETIKTNIINRFKGLIDIFKGVGTMLRGVFTLDFTEFKAGLASVGESVAQVASGVDNLHQKLLNLIITGENFDMMAFFELEKRMISLSDATREFGLVKAQTRQEIEKARLAAEDESLSAKERLDNLKKALELEAKTTAKELELQKERVALIREENDLAESTAEDLQALATAKIKLIELETSSIKMRKRVITEVNALEKEIETAKLTTLKKIADAKKAEEKRIADAKKIVDDKKIADDKKIEDNNKKLLRLQQDNTILAIKDEKLKNDKILEIQQERELAAIENLDNFEALKLEIIKKYELLKQNQKKATVEIENKFNTEGVAKVGEALGQAAALNEEGSKKWKKLKTAEAIIGTFLGAQRAYNSTVGIVPIGPILAPIMAGLAVAAGIKQVKSIQSTEIPTMARGGIVGGYGSGTSDSVNAKLSKGEAIINARSATMFRGALSSMNVAGGGVSFAGDDEGISEGKVIKTYVLSDEMTSSQERTDKINRRSSI